MTSSGGQDLPKMKGRKSAVWCMTKNYRQIVKLSFALFRIVLDDKRHGLFDS